MHSHLCLTRPRPALYHFSIQFAHFFHHPSLPFVIFKNRNLPPPYSNHVSAGAHNITSDNKGHAVEFNLASFEYPTLNFSPFLLFYTVSLISAVLLPSYAFPFSTFQNLCLLHLHLLPYLTPIPAKVSASASRYPCSHTNQLPHSQNHPFLIQTHPYPCPHSHTSSHLRSHLHLHSHLLPHLCPHQSHLIPNSHVAFRVFQNLHHHEHQHSM